MPKIRIPGYLIRLILFWGIALAAAFGLFHFVRDLTACWRLTSLPGTPHANCAGPAEKPLATPVIGADTPTPEAAAPRLVRAPDASFAPVPPLVTASGAVRVRPAKVGASVVAIP